MRTQVKNGDGHYPVYDLSNDKRGTNFIGDAIQLQATPFNGQIERLQVGGRHMRDGAKGKKYHLDTVVESVVDKGN